MRSQRCLSILLMCFLLGGNLVAAEKHYVTILGEVNQPGTYAIPEGKGMNILEALAQAGDMTVFGMRNKIMVTRVNTKGKFQTWTLNLDDSDVNSSPCFLLKPEDRVYVTPNKAKTKSASFGRKSTIWVSMVSTAVSVGGLIISKLKP